MHAAGLAPFKVIRSACRGAPCRLGGRITALALAAIAVSGCASTQQPTTASIANPPQPPVVLATAEASDGFDCKALTGRMQVRILDLRAQQATAGTTMLSRALKSGFSGIFGGSSSSQSEAAAAEARRSLDADNAKLKASGCNSFDLDADLAAPINGAVAANANVAAPIDASVAANILSEDSESTAIAQQDAIITQSITGSAQATSDQVSAIDQSSLEPVDTDTASADEPAVAAPPATDGSAATTEDSTASTGTSTP